MLPRRIGQRHSGQTVFNNRRVVNLQWCTADAMAIEFGTAHSGANPLDYQAALQLGDDTDYDDDRSTTFFGVRRGSKNFAPALKQLFEWLRDGKISVPIRATFKLNEIQNAHREYASGSGMGSIIIDVAS